jgi:hypothetical protein
MPVTWGKTHNSAVVGVGRKFMQTIPIKLGENPELDCDAVAKTGRKKIHYSFLW